MAVTIVVEDGTGVANANSYQTVANARAYALQRGISLSANDDVVGAQLVNATDYLESLECEYQGKRTDCETPQALAWPRKCVVLCCEDFPDNQIPKNLTAAQNTLVIAQHSGVNLFPNVGPSDYVIREKVGPIETEYADPTKAGITTRITGVDALLGPLFGSCGEVGVTLRTVRV
jgi:hypothetical protein